MATAPGTKIAIALTLALLACSEPAFASNTSTPPGNPCAKNNGNPCNGNNGNIGAQGNAGHEKTKIDKTPPAITLGMPPVSGRGVYISQIGDSNIASVTQNATNAYARIDQDGDHNEADIAQRGPGSSYIEAAQSGDSNFARSDQSGSGQNVAYVTQNGNGNWLSSRQLSLGIAYNGARLVQNGNNNDMTLDQEGSDNLALLSQQGDDNGMTATQLGAGNRLTWIQQGEGLSDLQITQTGGGQVGGQLMITQTNTGNGH